MWRFSCASIISVVFEMLSCLCSTPIPNLALSVDSELAVLTRVKTNFKKTR